MLKRTWSVRNEASTFDIFHIFIFCTFSNIYKTDANGEVAAFNRSIYTVHSVYINCSHTQPFLCLKTFPGQITSGNWRSWELDRPNVVHIHHSWKFSFPKTLYSSFSSFSEAFFSNFKRKIRYAISKLDHSKNIFTTTVIDMTQRIRAFHSWTQSWMFRFSSCLPNNVTERHLDILLTFIIDIGWSWSEHGMSVHEFHWWHFIDAVYMYFDIVGIFRLAPHQFYENGMRILSTSLFRCICI